MRKGIGMLPSIGYQGFRTARIPSGWGHMSDRWGLWWNGREAAGVPPNSRGWLPPASERSEDVANQKCSRR